MAGGQFFLTQRFVNEHPAAPSGIAIIGPGTFIQHYYDSRGVARTYQMTLSGPGVDDLARGTRLLAALHRDDLRRRHHHHRRVGRLPGRAGVEARLRPDLHQDRPRGLTSPTEQRSSNADSGLRAQ